MTWANDGVGKLVLDCIHHLFGGAPLNVNQGDADLLCSVLTKAKLSLSPTQLKAPPLFKQMEHCEQPMGLASRLFDIHDTQV